MTFFFYLKLTSRIFKWERIVELSYCISFREKRREDKPLEGSGLSPKYSMTKASSLEAL